MKLVRTEAKATPSNPDLLNQFVAIAPPCAW